MSCDEKMRYGFLCGIFDVPRMQIPVIEIKMVTFLNFKGLKLDQKIMRDWSVIFMIMWDIFSILAFNMIYKINFFYFHF